jgi:DNA-binding Xre family transcriptional regulator
MVSYKKLWVLLAQKELNKKKLMQMTGIGTSSMAKLTKGENVTTDILCRICKALDCDFKDIMEFVSDKGDN